MQKQIEEMKRHEIIFELAKHTPPSYYHSILNWPTNALRALLSHYIGMETDISPIVKLGHVTIGIDFGYGRDYSHIARHAAA